MSYHETLSRLPWLLSNNSSFLGHLSSRSFTKPGLSLWHHNSWHLPSDHHLSDSQLTFFQILDPTIRSPPGVSAPLTPPPFYCPSYLDGLSPPLRHSRALSSTASLCPLGRPSGLLKPMPPPLHTCPWTGKKRWAGGKPKASGAAPLGRWEDGILYRRNAFDVSGELHARWVGEGWVRGTHLTGAGSAGRGWGPSLLAACQWMGARPWSDWEARREVFEDWEKEKRAEWENEHTRHIPEAAAPPSAKLPSPSALTCLCIQPRTGWRAAEGQSHFNNYNIQVRVSPCRSLKPSTAEQIQKTEMSPSQTHDDSFQLDS